jgi:hypothetical protein
MPLYQIGKTSRLNEFQNNSKLVLSLDCVDVLHDIRMAQSFKKTDLL